MSAQPEDSAVPSSFQGPDGLPSFHQILDSELFELMHQNGDYTHFYFCYRWFLLDFKRGKDSRLGTCPQNFWGGNDGEVEAEEDMGVKGTGAKVAEERTFTQICPYWHMPYHKITMQ